MVKFKHDGNEWRVWFRHTEDYKHNKVTTAILDKRVEERKWEWQCEAVAVCHANDAYDRKLGNHVAFERLVDVILLRGLRTCMWNAYWVTTGHPELINLSVEGDLV